MTNAKFPLVALRRFVKINPNVVLPTKGEVEYLPMEKVRSGFFEHFVADISTLPSSLNAFAEGDVLMAKVTPCFENGNLCLASNICNQVGCCSTELFVLRPNTTLVLPEYLLFLLQAEEFKQTATKYMRGAGGLKRIPTDWLLNYKFPLPSLDVQAAILRVLHYVESKIQSINDAYHHKIEKLSEYRKSLITRVVTKGLDPNVEMKDSGYEWIGQIPKHWNIARVGVLYRLSNGLSKSGESFGHGLPFLTYGDAYKSTFTPKKLSGLVETTTSERVNYSVKRGDVFFTRTSETVEEIGLSSTCLKDIPDGTFAGFLIRARPLPLLLHLSLQAFISDPNVTDHFL